MRYYPVGLDILNRRCLVVGGGEVGRRKAERLLECGARVTVVGKKLTPALEALVKRFGPDILEPDGRLNRPALAERAFVDEESKKALEAITHPAIATEFFRRIEANPPDAVIVHDVPLLVESVGPDRYGAVIVVEAPREVRLERLEQRGIARADAEARMAQQASDEQRRAIATWVLDNSGDLDALEAQVEQIWPAVVAAARES